MSSKAERRAANDRVASYHQSCLTDLVDRLVAELDSYRATTMDMHQADQTIHQYHRAARKLWTFCFAGGVDVETLARLIDDQPQDTDWWAQGAVSDHH